LPKTSFSHPNTYLTHRSPSPPPISSLRNGGALPFAVPVVALVHNVVADVSKVAVADVVAHGAPDAAAGDPVVASVAHEPLQVVVVHVLLRAAARDDRGACAAEVRGNNVGAVLPGRNTRARVPDLALLLAVAVVRPSPAGRGLRAVDGLSDRGESGDCRKDERKEDAVLGHCDCLSRGERSFGLGRLEDCLMIEWEIPGGLFICAIELAQSSLLPQNCLLRRWHEIIGIKRKTFSVY
ncbi:hypothetical protein BJ742DRAFT_911488, partial [Cladochytrium replicatum]